MLSTCFSYTDAAGTNTEVGLIDETGHIWQPTSVALAGNGGTSRTQVDVIVPPEAPSAAYRFYILDGDGQPAPFGSLTIRQKQDEFLTADDVDNRQSR